jgi:hypothetical protein
MMKPVLQKIMMTATALALYAPIHAQGVAMEWAKRAGGTAYDMGTAVAVDAEKNTYVTGYFSGTASFNTGTDLVSNGDQDIFLAKLDWSGATVWVKQFGSDGRDAGLGLRLDAQNNIYLTGYYSSTIDFNPGGAPVELVSSGDADIFVVKLDSTGACMWAKSMGSDIGGDEGRAIALDPLGNVYTTGIFFGTADFDPGASSTTLTSSGSSEIFVSKLNNDGEFVWARRLGGNRLDSGDGIAVDDDGNVYTTGSFQRTADFDPGPGVYNLISGANSYDVFVSKLTTDGAFVWAKQFKGDSPNMGNGIALDQFANVYTTGMFSATTDFDPDATATFNLDSEGGTDIYVAKLDSAGTFIWAKRMGGSDPFGGDRGYAIAVDNLGNAYTTGFFSGTADFDPGTGTYDMTALGSSDIYVSKLDAAGNFLWARQLSGVQGTDWGTAIAVDASSNVYSTGLFNGTVDFDPGTGDFDLIAEGGTDIYMHKMLCTDTSSAQLQVTASCNGYTLNNQVFDATGTYTVVMANQMGCDSTVTLDLTIELPQAVISVDGLVLGTTQPFTSYQWYLNNTLIPGATQSTYTVEENGEYSVVVTDASGCADTAFYEVTSIVGIAPLELLQSLTKVYPNPATRMLYVSSPASVRLTLSSIQGATVLDSKGSKNLDLSDIADGIYLLRIVDAEGRLIKVEKIVKQ